MTFDTELYRVYIDVVLSGILAGFTCGFISWAIGYAVYAIIKFFKQS